MSYGVWTYCPKCHREVAGQTPPDLYNHLREHECLAAEGWTVESGEKGSNNG